MKTLKRKYVFIFQDGNAKIHIFHKWCNDLTSDDECDIFARQIEQEKKFTPICYYRNRDVIEDIQL
jgi:hypothetical protein